MNACIVINLRRRRERQRLLRSEQQVRGRPLPPIILHHLSPRPRRTPSPPASRRYPSGRVPFSSPAFAPPSSSPPPSRQSSPTISNTQSHLRPRRMPSPPSTRRAPYGRVPFDDPTFAPPSSSPPLARQPSPTIPASRRQLCQRRRIRHNRCSDITRDSHHPQSQATPPRTYVPFSPVSHPPGTSAPPSFLTSTRPRPPVIADCAMSVSKLTSTTFVWSNGSHLPFLRCKRLSFRTSCWTGKLSNLLPLLPWWQSHSRPFTGTPVTHSFPSC